MERWTDHGYEGSRLEALGIGELLASACSTIVLCRIGHRYHTIIPEKAQGLSGIKRTDHKIMPGN